MPALILVLLLPAPALAHGGAEAGTWLAPGLLAGWAMLYAIGMRRARRVRWKAVLAFAAGMLVAAAATLSPLHAAGRASFSWHMVEHTILMSAAAPLIVLGRPLVALLWATPRAWRRPVGRIAALGRPLSGALVYAAVLWLWHLPPLFDAVTRSEALHTLQHTTMLAASLAWWWSLLRGSAGTALASIFITSMHSSFLGALLTVSPLPLYASYPDLADQQLAGLIMWVPAGTVHLAAAIGFAARWLKQAEARVRRWEAAA
jgi:putative membrane protein